jgi:hypothetical protein
MPEITGVPKGLVPLAGYSTIANPPVLATSL